MHKRIESLEESTKNVQNGSNESDTYSLYDLVERLHLEDKQLTRETFLMKINLDYLMKINLYSKSMSQWALDTCGRVEKRRH